MTSEEFERLKDCLRAKLSDSESRDVDLEKVTAAAKADRERRKLDRDMNRIERALRKLADVPREPKRLPQEGRHWNEFKESFEKQHAEIREIAARSDAKIKALVEEMQRRNRGLS
jgi:predicted  nucleic acid-binding Zn-ribbon protein